MQKHNILRILHLAVGISGLIFFAGFDFLRGQALNFGLQQFAGLSISSIIILAGFADWMPLQKKYTWGTLFLLYLIGILFMGLHPGASHAHHHPSLLRLTVINRNDFIINILGFIPLGFMALAFLKEIRSTGSGYPLAQALVFCLTVSLLIEASQYFFLPGRTSSLNDVVANTMGALLGGVLEDLENHQRRKPHEQ
jgi:VanZ family protein